MPQPVLASFGIVFILVVLVCVVYFAARSFGAGGKSRRAAPADPVVEPEPDALSELRLNYEKNYLAADVPGSAMILRVVTNSYTPHGAAAKHYCWEQGGALRMFPLWESVAEGLSANDSVGSREWCIPTDNIICFAVEHGLPSKFVALQFKVDSEILTLSFSEEAARIFGELIPEKDYSQLAEQLYPRSSRNISDIRESFKSLKELRDSDLISEDEYAAKKKEMLILM